MVVGLGGVSFAREQLGGLAGEGVGFWFDLSLSFGEAQCFVAEAIAEVAAGPNEVLDIRAEEQATPARLAAAPTMPSNDPEPSARSSPCTPEGNAPGTSTSSRSSRRRSESPVGNSTPPSKLTEMEYSFSVLVNT